MDVCENGTPTAAACIVPPAQAIAEELGAGAGQIGKGRVGKGELGAIFIAALEGNSIARKISCYERLKVIRFPCVWSRVCEDSAA